VIEVARVIFNRSGIKLEEVTITSSSEILLAAQTLSQRGAQAIWITGDNTVLQGIDAVVKAANDSRLPLIINDPEFIKHGAIAAVGLGWYEAGYAGGLIASRVLSGESPDKIPFQEVAVKKVILNDSVAKRLGITFPKSLLEGATRVSN
jgi:putative ABC transport system substrate-binding protein